MITPRRVAQVVWRRKLLCSVVATIVFLAGAGLLLTRPKVYQSTSSVALLPVSTNASVLPNYPNLIASLIPTYVQLISSPVLLNQVAATLPFPTSGSQLANEVHAESLSSAAVINIVADSANATQAQQIASRATAVFLAQISGNGVVRPSIYGQPTVPDAPQAPRTRLLLVVILALAVILGLGAGLAWDRLFGSADGVGQVPETTRPPVLGSIPGLGGQPGVTPVLGGRNSTAPHDRWHSLRTNFMYATAGQQMHTVTVTSLASGEGKTTVALNLAASLAELGLSVVLVDAAVRCPAVHEVFGFDNDRGLTSMVLDGADPASLLRPVPTVPGLQVITAGPQLLAPRDEASLYLQQLSRLSSLGDFVIVDGPALQGDAAAALAASVSDGVVLVVRTGVPGPAQADAALRILARHDITVLGTVLTGTNGTVNRDQSRRDPDGHPISEAAGPAARPK